MKEIPFVKMHGLGNDFVIIDGRKEPVELNEKQIKAIGDRHRGVGFDQLIVLSAPKTNGTDAFMSIYNNDGSKAGACGNATRCVASIIINETGQEEAVIETVEGGLLRGWAADNGLIRVNMGMAKLNWDEIPLASEVDTLKIPAQNDDYANPTAVSMGNPHTVFFVDDAEAVELEKNGSYFEHHDMFPERTNVEFVTVMNNGKLRMRVWERGAGITQACGTGACASLVAAVRNDLLGGNRKAEVVLDGGSLFIEWLETGDVMMTGAVATSFEGVLDNSLVG
ncbi:MAG: diaminopimelate epimerase [Alphaproteobacteria bacterium]|nr:diaminopimelate epimerase [Alphaproteobacteria bacterium]